MTQLLLVALALTAIAVAVLIARWALGPVHAVFGDCEDPYPSPSKEQR